MTIDPVKMPVEKWRIWFKRQIAKRGEPDRNIPPGNVCGACGRMGWHEGTCRNPWDIRTLPILRNPRYGRKA